MPLGIRNSDSELLHEKGLLCSHTRTTLPHPFSPSSFTLPLPGRSPVDVLVALIAIVCPHFWPQRFRHREKCFDAKTRTQKFLESPSPHFSPTHPRTIATIPLSLLLNSSRETVSVGLSLFYLLGCVAFSQTRRQPYDHSTQGSPCLN